MRLEAATSHRRKLDEEDQRLRDCVRSSATPSSRVRISEGMAHRYGCSLLARGIYDERAFDRMPILADALQDAGCDNDDILNASPRRESTTTFAAAGALDLVLGKE